MEKQPSEEEKPEREPGTEEAPPAAAPVIKIEQPLEAKEFDQFLGVFMSKAGISDRKKAAILATRALRNIGLDPTTHLEEAVKGTQFLTAVLSTLPDAGDVTRATKDVVVAQGVSNIGEKILQGPTPEDRMERVMQMMMPYIMIMRMASGGDMGGSGAASTKSADVEELKAEFARFRDDIKGEKFSRAFDERFGKLERQMEKLSERKPEQGEGVLAKKLDELKTAKESDVGKKVEELTKALAEKERTGELEALAGKMDEVKQSFETKIGNIEASMNQGAPQKDVIGQASELLTSMGNYFKGFGETAKAMGFEPKDEKLSGDIRRDMLGLGKKALEVVDRSVKYRGEKPPKKEVQQLPPPSTATIPIPGQPAPAPAEAESPPEVPPPAPPEEKPPAETVIPPLSPERPSKLSLFTRKPETEPETPPEEKPPEEAPAEAETPPEEPPEAPPEAPPEKPPEKPRKEETEKEG